MPRMPIHFTFDSSKGIDAQLAQDLIHDMGQVNVSEAFAIVSIGGDGTLLRALNMGAGKKVLGLTANATSKGFWTNRLVDPTPDRILGLLESTTAYPISPIGVTIHFADGTQTRRHGFNDIIVRPAQNKMHDMLRRALELPATDISIQSMLATLFVSHAGHALGRRPIMGSGLIFATAYGSTAINHAYAGPALDIRNEAIILTGMGITDPAKGFNSIVCDVDTAFRIDVPSPDKRPIVVGYDSFGVAENEAGSPITSLVVSIDRNTKAHLILQDSPGTRAFSALNLVT